MGQVGGRKEQEKGTTKGPEEILGADGYVQYHDCVDVFTSQSYHIVHFNMCN